MNEISNPRLPAFPLLQPPPPPAYRTGTRTLRRSPLVELFTHLGLRWRLIALIALLVLGLGAAWTLSQPRTYTASALVMINPTRERVVSEQQTLTQAYPDSTYVDSQIEALKAPGFKLQIVQDLGLADDPAWNPSLRSSSPAESLSDAAFALVGRWLPGASSDAARPQTVDEAEAIAAASLADAMDVRRRGLTWVIEISITSRSAEGAAAVANRAAELYLRSQIDSRIETASQANAWLGERLAELLNEVRRKEAAAQAYRANKGLLTSEGVSLLERQIAELQAAAVAAKADHAESKARRDQLVSLVAAGGGAETLSGALTSEVIRDLRANEAAVARRQAELETRYGEKHPAVEAARKERADAQRQIQDEITRIASGLENDAASVSRRVQTLERSLAEARASLTRHNAEQVALTELETDAKAARAVYESFLQRFHEVSRQGDLGAAEAKLLSAAQVPGGPSSPSIPIYLAFFAALGIALGCAAAFLAEQFRTSFLSADEVTDRLGMPVLSSVPALKKRDMRGLPRLLKRPISYVVRKPVSPFAEAFRVLRTSVMLTTGHSRRRIVMVTSALPGEGKTTVSLCLARTAAASGQRVLVIDCDVRRRQLTTELGISAKAGVAEVMLETAAWRDVIGHSRIAEFDVIPAAKGPPPVVDLFSTPAMDRLMHEAMAIYDLIVLDCPPVLSVADPRSLVRHSDMVVMACRWRKTPERAVDAAIRQIEAVGGRVDGVVLNRINFGAAGQVSHYDPRYFKFADTAAGKA
jgi:polysaccharide biosynthesis transport protein